MTVCFRVACMALYTVSFRSPCNHTPSMSPGEETAFIYGALRRERTIFVQHACILTRYCLLRRCRKLLVSASFQIAASKLGHAMCTFGGSLTTGIEFL